MATATAPPVHVDPAKKYDTVVSSGQSALRALLTIMADFMGIMGGAFLSTRFYGVESHFYWEHCPARR